MFRWIIRSIALAAAAKAVKSVVERRAGGASTAAPAGGHRRSAWWSGDAPSLNSRELPASPSARSQHEEPMRHSENVVDEAFMSHRNGES